MAQRTSAARPGEVAVVGAGMLGNEKAHAIVGTRGENRNPGLTCDVPSLLYSYPFAPNPEWSSRFAPGPEIHRC